jgi:hypothetical protein
MLLQANPNEGKRKEGVNSVERFRNAMQLTVYFSLVPAAPVNATNVL